MSTNFLLILAALSVLSFTFANIAKFKDCSSDDVCDISEVRIDPCSNPKKCRLRKGYNCSISFDFTPKFSSEKMLTGMYWTKETGDLPFADLHNANACDLTACPLEAGKKQELRYGLTLGKKLPDGIFPIKWKLWNPDNENEACCFKATIELRK